MTDDGWRQQRYRPAVACNEILLISSSASLFGAWDQISGPAVLFALPIAIWEFSFGIYMMVKGFRPAIAADSGSAAIDTPRGLVTVGA